MSSHLSSKVWLLALSAVSAATLPGCSGSNRPALGTVEGVVTLDNKPLANAMVSFKPESGRGSFGVTDQDGTYELFYIRDIKGAIVGAHTIRITTATESARMEQLPARYNVRSELKRDVQAGENTLDFELSSSSTKSG